MFPSFFRKTLFFFCGCKKYYLRKVRRENLHTKPKNKNKIKITLTRYMVFLNEGSTAQSTADSRRECKGQ